METNQRKIEEIKPYPNNTKDHPEKQIKKISASIKEFGFNQPIVVDKNDTIIVGHGRYMAAMHLGLTEVPVLKLDLTEEQAKSYRLADNKLNESTWKMDIVIEELRSMSIEMIDLSGFDKNLILETEEDKPDLSSIGKPKSVSGDVYDLGQHKLICGDSTDPEVYKKLLGGEKARLIFTDPPYSVDYHLVNKHGKEKGGYSYNSVAYGGTGGRIFNDNKSPSEALEFYKDVLKQFNEFSTEDVTLYWWYASRLTDINMQAARENNWHFSQTIIWLKENIVYSPGQLFHRIYEPCMVFWKEKGKPHYQNRTFSKFSELWTLDKKKFAEMLDLWYQKRDNINNYIHPTQKPVQLAERALKRSSAENDIVLDAFGGSGSTLLACDQLNRRARLIELDPKYVDVIVTRYLQFKEETHVTKNGEKILW
jgi:DNA modification methylase